MDRNRPNRHLSRSLTRAALALTVFALVSAGLLASPAAALEGSYLYSLSTFTGTIPFEWVPVTIDEQRGEVYVADAGERSVRIFNEAGMEAYRFGDDERLGQMRDLAVLPSGDVLLLSYQDYQGEPAVVRCDYRGEPQERVVLAGLPEGWSDFRPDRMLLRGERLYLAALGQMRIAVSDLRGNVIAHHDLGVMLKLEARNAGLGGFTVDAGGRIFFTVPVNFQVHILSPDGSLDSFGQPGSSNGKFGVVAGVAVDAEGRIFVADTLRCTVIVFSREHDFVGEIGNRSWRAGGLIAPRGVAIAADGKLYVTQMGRKGVGVYRYSAGDVAAAKPAETGKSS
jgi:DNA-binding beta-propeller fold protein YncE